MSFDEGTALRLIGEMLGMAHLVHDGVAEIKVRAVMVVDQSLTVEALATSEDPVRLRGQAASIMGGLSGLDLAGLFPALHFRSFAVRLCNRRGEDLFWIISSPEDARFSVTGAVRWLANSIFQDNTPAYQRSIADPKISQLETGLRDLLHDHWVEEHGPTYAEKVFTDTLLKNLRKSARKEGEDETDGRALLDLTLLHQLRDLACSEALLLEHGCVEAAERFASDLEILNRIRRKVAHHRAITSADTEETRRIAMAILGPVGRYHPGLVDDFLVDRWDAAVADIFSQSRSGFSQPEPPARNTLSEIARRDIAIGMLEEQLDAAMTALSSIRQLVVPPTRQQRHDAVEEAFSVLVEGLTSLISVAASPHVTVAQMEAASGNYEHALGLVRRLGEDILEMRVLEPTD